MAVILILPLAVSSEPLSSATFTSAVFCISSTPIAALTPKGSSRFAALSRFFVANCESAMLTAAVSARLPPVAVIGTPAAIFVRASLSTSAKPKLIPKLKYWSQVFLSFLILGPAAALTFGPSLTPERKLRSTSRPCFACGVLTTHWLPDSSGPIEESAVTLSLLSVCLLFSCTCAPSSAALSLITALPCVLEMLIAVLIGVFSLTVMEAVLARVFTFTALTVSAPPALSSGLFLSLAAEPAAPRLTTAALSWKFIAIARPV